MHRGRLADGVRHSKILLVAPERREARNGDDLTRDARPVLLAVPRVEEAEEVDSRVVRRGGVDFECSPEVRARPGQEGPLQMTNVSGVAWGRDATEHVRRHASVVDEQIDEPVLFLDAVDEPADGLGRRDVTFHWNEISVSLENAR